MLPEIFRATVRAHADRVAIEIPPSSQRPLRQSCTYGQLDAQSRAIAARLVPALAGRHDRHAQHEPHDQIVPVLLPRASASLYAAQLGVHLARGAFTCLDCNFPDAHIRCVILDCGSSTVVTDSAGCDRLARIGFDSDLEIVNVDALDLAAHAPPRDGGEGIAPTDPRSLAYVIYTSGTTGAPKGVMIEHRSIANLVRSDLPRFELNHTDRVAQCSSPAYDSSLEETWLALAVGATLVLLDDETIRLGPDLVEWINRDRVTVLCPPPTLLRTLGCADPSKALPSVRLLYVGGEALPQDLADSWSIGRRLENGYGPTECTVTVLRTQIFAGVPVTIGQPVDGNGAHILDEQLREVEAKHGAEKEGELCISGIALARGYHNLPLVTAEKFIDHPRLGRVYRTGDLVRRAASGAIEYLGRLDGQVKLRGYRVELSAIDSVLAGHAAILEAACRVQGEGAARFIAAHLVLRDPSIPLPLSALRAVVAAALPSYMIPARFATIAAIPRTVGGKIDRGQLPDISAAAPTVEPPEGKLQPLETTLVRCIASALSMEGPLAIDDDFFVDLGGDSLSAVGAVCHFRLDPTTAQLSVRDIYEQRTVRNLARRLEQTPRHGFAARTPIERVRMRAADPAIAAVVQFLLLAVGIVISSASAYLVLFALLPNLLDAIGIFWTIAAAPIVMSVGYLVYGVFMIAWTVALKRALIGRYTEGSIPVYSSEFLRHWIVQQSARAIPWGLIEGTVLLNAVLRMLGARIGARVHIHRGVDLFRGGWDLLSIGDDSTLAQDASLALLSLREGHLVIASATLQARCTVDVRAGLGPGAHMEADSSLAPLSYLLAGARIPANERWDGVPARRVGHTPALLDAVRGDGMGTLAHGLLMIGIHLGFGLIRMLAWMVIGFILAANSHRLDPRLMATTLLLSVPVALAVSLFMQALGLRALGPTRPGNVHRWSAEFATIWEKTRAVDTAGRWLSGSLLWPIWLRIAGMRVGRGCEISTIIDVIPDTVTIGDGCFFADGIYFASPRVNRGVVSVDATTLGANTFIGNHAVMPAGPTYGRDLFIGVSTVADARLCRSGSSWFGQPPMELPRREVISIDRALTHDPAMIRWLNRLMWELARFTLPLLPISVGLAWWWGVAAAGDQWSTIFVALVAAPIATVLSGFVIIGSIVALKWILLGRVRPGQHAFWSCWCCRWDFLFVAWSILARRTLDALEGTVFLTWFLRAVGVRIGRRVVLGRGFTQVVDPDMLTIEDDATVDCNFQAHSFEDRILKIDRVHIGRGSTLGHHAVLFYGVTIGEGATVEAHSVVMKRQRVDAGTISSGVPASAAPAISTPVSHEERADQRDDDNRSE